jgi:Ca2+-binding EF-hand superfamily protein
MFAMLDANKDGAITEDEMGPMGRMISRLDTDGNGKVTTEEFTEMQLRRFDRMDENHDGQLTKAERDAAMAAMRERMGGGTPPPQ